MVPQPHNDTSDDYIDYDINFLFEVACFNYSLELIINALNTSGIRYVIESNIDDIKSLQSYNPECSDSFFITINREDFGEGQIIISRYSKDYINFRLALNFDSGITNHGIDAIVIALITQFEIFFQPDYVIAGETTTPFIPINDNSETAEYMYISKNLSKEIKLKSNTFSLELPNGVLYRT